MDFFLLLLKHVFFIPLFPIPCLDFSGNLQQQCQLWGQEENAKWLAGVKASKESEAKSGACVCTCVYVLVVGGGEVNEWGASECSEDAGQKNDAPTWLRLKYHPRALMKPNSQDI